MRIEQRDTYLIDDGSCGQRLDNYLIKILKNVPKSCIYRIIRTKKVKVNNLKSSPDYKLLIGDIVKIPYLEEVNRTANNRHIIKNNHNTDRETSNHSSKLLFSKDWPNILYEDDHYLIINKSINEACHGGSGISLGVIEKLRIKFASKYKFLELVHRLDRATSGILIIAKTRSGLVKIQELIRVGQLEKNYLVLSIGTFDKNTFMVNVPLKKLSQPNGTRMVFVDHDNGKESITKFQVLERFDIHPDICTKNNTVALLKATLKTGRTHQIRVHLQSVNKPIIGDDKYGDFTVNHQIKKYYSFDRMFLHASNIKFKHPMIDSIIDISSPIEDNYTLNQLIIKLRKGRQV